LGLIGLKTAVFRPVALNRKPWELPWHKLCQNEAELTGGLGLMVHRYANSSHLGSKRWPANSWKEREFQGLV